jgi:hypothetical protein
MALSSSDNLLGAALVRPLLGWGLRPEADVRDLGEEGVVPAVVVVAVVVVVVVVVASSSFAVPALQRNDRQFPVPVSPYPTRICRGATMDLGCTRCRTVVAAAVPGTTTTPDGKSGDASSSSSS